MSNYWVVHWDRHSWHGLRPPLGAVPQEPSNTCGSKEEAFWKLLELEARWPYEKFRLMTLDEWHKEADRDIQDKVAHARR